MNTFNLAKLIEVVGGSKIGDCDLSSVVKGVSSSSKDPMPGKVFFAIRGHKYDGHQYVREALDSGALAAVVEDAGALGANLPGVLVKDSRLALSRASAKYFGEPTKEVSVTGVTGTSGKTTTVWLLSNLLRMAGYKAVRLGSLGTDAPGIISDPDTLTTADTSYIHEVIAKSKIGGVSHAVMEVSSHGLTQSRVDDVQFDVAVFTNLNRDHLDYHKGFEDYFEAKAKLFDLLERSSKSDTSAVICVDDSWGKALIERVKNHRSKLITFGVSNGADIQVEHVSQSLDGSQVGLSVFGDHFEFECPLIGRHNALNIAGVLGAGASLGVSVEEMISHLRQVPQVPGRLQRVSAPGVGIYVDYSHKPDALESVLNVLRPMCQRKLWVVFGCGGDRDKGKRPIMGEIAGRLADRVVVTSDNPRTEDPAAILADILACGIQPALAEIDRACAIKYAIDRLEEGDIALIAGKGHEDYQIFGTSKVHFSDVEVCERAVAERFGHKWDSVSEAVAE